MSALRYATMLTTPDAHGYATARLDGTTRRVYVDPLRFVAPAPVPAVGERVLVAPDETHGQTVLAILGRGTPP